MNATRTRLPLQTIFVLCLVGVGGWLGISEFQERLIYVKESDARIAAHLVTVSSRVDGWLTAVQVVEGQEIVTAAPIAQLDGRAASLALEELAAQLAGLEAERARLNAERRMMEAQTATLLETRASRVQAADAVARSLEPQLNLARLELDRAEALFKDGVVPKQQLDQARSTVHQLNGQYLSAVARLAEAEGELAEARASRTRMEVVDAEIAKLVHRKAELAGQVSQGELALADRAVLSPISGVVDRVFVEAGEYLRAGQRIALLHDPDQLWVDANVKETELRRLAPGQPVNVLVDAFPDEAFTGKVARIGSATTATFALLPNPNPSGNFTKITQRLPIRIDLDGPDRRLRPGLMVEIQIDVR